MLDAGWLILRAESSKLIRHRGIWAVLLAAIFLCGFIQWHNASVQNGWYQAEQSYALQLGQLGNGNGCISPIGGPCDAVQISEQRASVEAGLAQASQALKWGAAGLTLLGSVVVGLGLLGSGIGFILGVVIATIGIELETRSGGLKSTVLAMARRRNVVFGKGLACYLVSIGVTVICLAVLVAETRALRDAVPSNIVPGQMSVSGVPPVWVLVLSVLLTPAVGISIALVGAFAGRTSLAAIGGVAALVIADRVVAIALPGLSKFTIIGALSGLTHALSHSRLAMSSMTVALWPSQQSYYGSVVSSMTEILLVVVLSIWLSVVVLMRSEIR